MWPARWSSYRSRCSIRASSASSPAGVIGGSAGAIGLARRVSVVVTVSLRSIPDVRVRIVSGPMSREGRRAVIVGVATSDYPHLPEMSEHQVHAQAAGRALADAGATYADVDGYATAGFMP